MVAVGRKNWLFAGSMAGAHRAALLYSLVQSCKLVDVPPFAYLKDVLVRVATHPHRDIPAHAQRLGPDLRPASLRLIRLAPSSVGRSVIGFNTVLAGRLLLALRGVNTTGKSS